MSKGGLIWYTWVVNRWSCGWRMMWMIEVLQPVSIQVVPALDTVFFRMRVFMWNFSVSRQRPAKICVEFVVLKIPKEFIVEFWIHQVCVSCAGRSGCRICEVLYTRTSTFFCPKELFAFLVLRHFGIDGCHGTTRFSFAWLRVIEYGHLIVRSEEGCRTIFCLFSLSRMRTLSIASCFSAYMLDRYGIAIFDRLILILDVVPAPSVTANLQDWWGGLASSFPK